MAIEVTAHRRSGFAHDVEIEGDHRMVFDAKAVISVGSYLFHFPINPAAIPPGEDGAARVSRDGGYRPRHE